MFVVSKSIVEAHGGVVGVHSAGLGHGSTFFFEIPGRLNENHHTAEGTEETETISTDYYTGLLSPRSHAAPRTPTASANKTGSTGAEDLIDDTQSLNASSMSSPALSPSSSHVGLDVLVDESEPPTLRVLIADDAPVARKIVERLLLSASIYVDADGRIDLPSTFSAAANAGSNAVSTAAGNPRSFASTALQLFLPRKERSPSYDSTASSGNATLVPARKERSLSNISTSMVSVSSSDAGFQPTSPQTVTTLRDASEDPQASTTPSAHRLRSFSTVERNFTRSISVDIGSPERRNAPSLLPPAHTINMATPTWPIAPNASTGSLQQSTSSVGIADAAFIEVSPRALTMSPQLSSPIIQALPEPFFPATPLQPSQVPSATTSSSLLRLMVEVEHATNGQICVDKLSQSMLPWRKTFDVVLVDYYMPVLDGEAAIRQIRQHKYDGVVIALTGATSKEDAERLLSAGATAVMPKPFDLSSFLRILAEYYRCSTVLASLRGATSTLHSSPPRNIAGSSSLAPLARTVLEGADDGQENPV